MLVKFLRDFVVGVDSVIIETYYAPPETPVTTDFSTQWEGTISFLGILEVSYIDHRVDWYASCEHVAGWLYRSHHTDDLSRVIRQCTHHWSRSPDRD